MLTLHLLLRKFLFNSTLVGSFCSLWIMPSLAMQDDLEWKEAFERGGMIKENLKRKGYKKEDLLEVGKKFSGSGYKLSSLASWDLNVLAEGAKLGCLSALYYIGRFVSTPKEENYEWNPKIAKILKQLKKKESPSDSSIFEQGLQFYLHAAEKSKEYSSQEENFLKKMDEKDIEKAPRHKKAQTYLEYLEEIEEEQKNLDEKKQKQEEAYQSLRERYLEEIEEEQKGLAKELDLKLKREEEEATTKSRAKEERRHEREIKFQEELIDKHKRAEEDFNKGLEDRKKANEDNIQRRTVEAASNLSAERRIAEEQLQKELTVKKKAAEELFEQEIAIKKLDALEAASKKALESEEKLEAKLKAIEEQFQKKYRNTNKDK